MRMQRESRLRTGQEYSRTFTKGRRWANSLVALRVVSNGLEGSRFGFVTSKKVGKAVVRNTVKRRLREIARQVPVKGGWDLVLVAQKGTGQASFQQLKEAVLELWVRAGCLSLPETSMGEGRGN